VQAGEPSGSGVPSGRRHPDVAVLFDWGDTVMRVFPECTGPMVRWPRVEAMPGVRQTLRALRPHAVIALATNAADSRRAQIRAALKRVRLSACFQKIYCFRALGVRKPSPEYFAAVLEDLCLPPERVVLVGDDWPADVEGAIAAGLWAVWYNPCGREERHLPRAGTVHEMAALPALLGTWGLLPG
jgi:HAD superfamily hydrolase (TIGR01509 family)